MAVTVELRRLTYFAEVVEQGSISRAAGNLGLSQPALTKSLRQLEEDFGVKLLERSNNGVAPTVFGKSVYGHARSVIAEVEHAKAEINRLRGLDEVFVSVGALPSVAGSILATAVAKASTRTQRLAVRVVEKNHFELLPALRRGEFDFVIGIAEHGSGRIPPPDTGIRRSIILRDRLSIIVRAGHPLAGAEQVDLAKLASHRWLFPMVDAVHRPVLEQFFLEAGVTPPLAMVESTSVQFTKSMILESDHVGVLPAHVMAQELAEGSIVPLPVQSDTLRRSIAIFYRERHPLSAAARIVVRALKAVCRTPMP